MRNIAPDIFRQRLIVEGYYTVELSKDTVAQLLLELAAHLHLRVYSPPIVFAPATGMGSDENAGFDAFVPLIDSGISAYFWSSAKFFSVVLYTCKGFDESAAVAFLKERLATQDEVVSQSF